MLVFSPGVAGRPNMENGNKSMHHDNLFSFLKNTVVLPNSMTELFAHKGTDIF